MKKTLFMLLALLALFACNKPADQHNDEGEHTEQSDDFKYKVDQFADVKVLRYQVPGFDDLAPKQKELLYYLYEAALCGRDIFYDQNYKHNLSIRRTIEAIVKKNQDSAEGLEWEQFMLYAKRFWVANGIHHHYSQDKFKPEFPKAYFAHLVKELDEADLPLQDGESVDAFIERITPIIFDPNIDAKKVNKAAGVDQIAESAVNFYEGVTQKEVEKFYADMADSNDKTPISYGLNSKVVKEGGKLVEKKWHVGGMYSEAIAKVAYWLEKAVEVAENEQQAKALAKLADYYRTGKLRTFDEYNIEWVADTSSAIDVINGFIEVYDDPIGIKASFESVVSAKDMEASKRIVAISKEAQWFEDHSSIMDEHKKDNVVGISAKVINVVIESGATAPTGPIGINLPNSNWIRENHGSKSVNLGNIVHAYDMANRGGGFLDEFAASQEEIDRVRAHGGIADLLHTDMHEVIGHASGKRNPGVGTPKETMKSYASTLEEARADLVALYYLMDQKLVDMGLMESLEVGKASYDDYIRNGMLTQLSRIEIGKDIEEDHMRNRQLNCMWAYEKGKADNVIEYVKKDGKTYVVVNDYEKLRVLFGDLLREIQRIKSEGDYEAGKNLVENYGVKVDVELHKEVKERYDKLNSAPYGAFIQPKLVPVKEDGKIVNVKVEYPDNFVEQMLYYGENYSFLPDYN